VHQRFLVSRTAAGVPWAGMPVSSLLRGESLTTSRSKLRGTSDPARHSTACLRPRSRACADRETGASRRYLRDAFSAGHSQRTAPEPLAARSEPQHPKRRPPRRMRSSLGVTPRSPAGDLPCLPQFLPLRGRWQHAVLTEGCQTYREGRHPPPRRFASRSSSRIRRARLLLLWTVSTLSTQCQPRAAALLYIGRTLDGVRIGPMTLRSVRTGPLSATVPRPCCVTMLSQITRSPLRQSWLSTNSGL